MPLLKLAIAWNAAHPDDPIPEEEIQIDAKGEDIKVDDGDDAFTQARKASMVTAGAIHDEYIKQRLALADEINPEHRKNREKSEALIKILLEEEKEREREKAEMELREATRLKELEAKGQWTCSTCTFANDKDILKCGACGAERHAHTGPKSSAMTAGLISTEDQAITSTRTTTDRVVAIQGRRYNGKEKASRSQDTWQCEACTFVNSLKETNCSVCGSMCNDDKALELNGKWKCSKCTLLNQVTYSKCTACHAERRVDLKPPVSSPPSSMNHGSNKRKRSSAEKKKSIHAIPSNTLANHGFYQQRIESEGCSIIAAKTKSQAQSNHTAKQNDMAANLDNQSMGDIQRQRKKQKSTTETVLGSSSSDVSSFPTASQDNYWTCNNCYILNALSESTCECCKKKRLDLKPIHK